MNVHLFLDKNFVSGTIDLFEKFYRTENIYIILKEKLDIIQENELKNRIFFFNPQKKNLLNEIENIFNIYKIKNIILHGIFYEFYNILLNLNSKKIFFGKVYWIFWGYELYNALGEINKYKLLDNTSPLSLLSYISPTKYQYLLKKILRKKTSYDVLIKILPFINYFCFWFPYDYELLKNHFEYPIKFKFFKYTGTYRSQKISLSTDYEKKQLNLIMVNHQASRTGNHMTILKKLKDLSGIKKYEILTPLSYGSSHVKKLIIKNGKRLFKDKFHPLMDYIPLDKYELLLNTVPVAIFGALRQEASGNIIRLLKSGTKIFLRESNPLLSFYQNKGYIIFSFEKDLNSIEDLNGLSKEQMIQNFNVYINTRIDYEDFMNNFIE